MRHTDLTMTEQDILDEAIIKELKNILTLLLIISLIKSLD